MFKWLAKKFVLGKVNKALSEIKNGDGISGICDKAERLALLAGEIAAAAKDRNISDDEASSILSRIEEFFV